MSKKKNPACFAGIKMRGSTPGFPRSFPKPSLNFKLRLFVDLMDTMQGLTLCGSTASLTPIAGGLNSDINKYTQNRLFSNFLEGLVPAVFDLFYFRKPSLVPILFRKICLHPGNQDLFGGTLINVVGGDR